MKPFPYFIARIAGAPFSYLNALSFKEAPGRIERILTKDEEINECRSPVCDALHAYIPTLTDTKLQNRLLNIKRAVFNGKELDPKELEDLNGLVPEEVYAKLVFYCDLTTERKRLVSEYSVCFREEAARTRNALKEISADTDLQKGLLLSSHLLLDNIRSYVSRDPSDMRKKELKTEESLVKYISRMAGKTSPFSTFTNLSVGAISGNAGNTGSMPGERVVESHICLNNHLFAYLKGLFSKLPEIYRHFPLRANSTITVSEEGFLFLTNSNNIESFQRMPANPVVELFYDLVKEAPPTGVKYKDLVAGIVEGEYIDASAEDIESYINQLISYGFLEFSTGVSGIDPFWDRKLVGVLEEIAPFSALAGELRDTLNSVRQLAKEYGEGDLEQRKGIIKKAFREFREVCMRMHEAAGLPEEERRSPEEIQRAALEKQKEAREKAKAEKESSGKTESEESAGKEEQEMPQPGEEAFVHRSHTYFHFKPEQVFYEDTTVNTPASLESSQAIELMGSVNRLLGSLESFDGLLDEQEKMAQFFREKYGTEKRVDLMPFYEDYYREVKKPEAEKLNKLKEERAKAAAQGREDKEKNDAAPKENKPAESEAYKIAATEERRKLNKERLEKWISTKNLQAGENVDIPKEDFPEPGGAAAGKLRSGGTFAQVYYENGELKAVLNASFPGFGKMFSRFLHLFDGSLTEELRTWNTEGVSEDIMVENCDASFFNANLHPPLMPFEIWIPGGQNSLPADKQIPITDITVQYDQGSSLLKLIHKPTGKNVYVFDLGFQGQKGRSQLFQMLSRFTLSRYLHWALLTNTINVKVRELSSGKEIVVLPRISFENRIVIQRKTWLIKKENLPVAGPNEGEEEYFLKLNLWRKKAGLPDQVFVYITNHGEMETLTPEQLAKLGRDSYKPQYINFNSHLLVNLLSKMIDRVPVLLRAEEMLPGPEQLLSFRNEKFVSEYVLQWYEVPAEAAMQKQMESLETTKA
jgi:lantibiotic biosynthesis protein